MASNLTGVLRKGARSLSLEGLTHERPSSCWSLGHWGTRVRMVSWMSLGSQDSCSSIRAPGIFTAHCEQGHPALLVLIPAAPGAHFWCTNLA